MVLPLFWPSGLTKWWHVTNWDENLFVGGDGDTDTLTLIWEWWVCSRIISGNLQSRALKENAIEHYYGVCSFGAMSQFTTMATLLCHFPTRNDVVALVCPNKILQWLLLPCKWRYGHKLMTLKWAGVDLPLRGQNKYPFTCNGCKEPQYLTTLIFFVAFRIKGSTAEIKTDLLSVSYTPKLRGIPNGRDRRKQLQCWNAIWQMDNQGGINMKPWEMIEEFRSRTVQG